MVPNSMPNPGMNSPKAAQGKKVPEELLDCGKDCVSPEVCIEKGCVLYGNAESGDPAAPSAPSGDMNPFE